MGFSVAATTDTCRYQVIRADREGGLYPLPFYPSFGTPPLTLYLDTASTVIILTTAATTTTTTITSTTSPSSAWCILPRSGTAHFCLSPPYHRRCTDTLLRYLARGALNPCHLSSCIGTSTSFGPRSLACSKLVECTRVLCRSPCYFDSLATWLLLHLCSLAIYRPLVA